MAHGLVLSVSEVVMSKTFENLHLGKLWLVLVQEIVVLEHVVRSDQSVVQRDEVVHWNVDRTIVFLITERLFFTVDSHVVFLVLKIEGLKLPVQILLEKLLCKIC